LKHRFIALAAAPSWLAGNGSGAQPSVAFAEYNPQTGAYMAFDGHLSQSNLVTASAEIVDRPDAKGRLRIRGGPRPAYPAVGGKHPFGPQQFQLPGRQMRSRPGTL
jgi:hypothetical protein